MQYEADPRLQQPEIDSQETLSLEAQGGDFMLAKYSGKYQRDLYILALMKLLILYKSLFAYLYGMWVFR